MSGNGDAPLVDEDRLRIYLDAFVPREGPPSYSVRRHRVGHANETFLVTWGRRELVLRRPPRGLFLPAPHDVIREHRVLVAAHGAGARVPRPVIACQDETVIGAPFYLMEKVEGHVVRTELPPDLDSPEARARIGDEMVDALAEVHDLHWLEAGLKGLAPTEGHVERQVRRWTAQLEITAPWTERSRRVPELVEAAKWLASHVPVAPMTCLVHGDYKLDNVVLEPGTGRVVAVLDWGMSTLGDPLTDLGWMLSFWRESGDPEEDLPAMAPRVTELPGFRTRRELVKRYEARTEIEVDDLRFYEALAVWKLAVALEGDYARYLNGVAKDPSLADLERAVPTLARRALAITRRSEPF